MIINNDTEIKGFKVGEKVLHKLGINNQLCKILEFYAPTKDRVKVYIEVTEMGGYSQYVDINDLHKLL